MRKKAAVDPELEKAKRAGVSENQNNALNRDLKIISKACKTYKK